MALPTYMFVTLANLMFCLTGCGSGLRVVIQPQPFTFSTKELNISCIADEPAYLATSILNIQMTRHIGDKYIASVNMRKELRIGVGVKENVKAEGHIGTKSNTSYLNLIIDKPDRQDAGLYRCEMFFTNENFQVVEKNVIGNVTYQEQDIRGVVKDLDEKVSDLQTKIIKQNKTMQSFSKQHTTFRDIHSELNIDMDILTENMDKQNNTDMKLTKQINDQNTIINNQTKQIDKLSKDNTKKQGQLDMLMEYITGQNKTIQKLQSQIQDINKRVYHLEWKYYEGDRTFIRVFGNGNTEKQLSWDQARQACQAFPGGDLVQIHDNAKNAFVYNMAKGSIYTYIGIKNKASGAFDFHYVDGSALGSYHPWWSGEPNGNYKCVVMSMGTSYPGRWGDAKCPISRPYVCSVPAY